MAKKVNKTEEQFAQVEEALTKTEQYIEDNQKSLMLIVGVIIGIIALYIGYDKLYMEPLEREAQSEIYMAELYFQKDSFNIALNGDGQYSGFLDVSDDYSNTKAGQLANYYAGLCYLYTNQYEDAIDYLSDFNSDNITLSTLALGCIGDAYVELGEKDKALDYYREASDYDDNDFTRPRFLMKEAAIHEFNEDFEDAMDIYKIIQNEYKTSREAEHIDKYISRAENR